jgi:hypothetical protein
LGCQTNFRGSGEKRNEETHARVVNQFWFSNHPDPVVRFLVKMLFEKNGVERKNKEEPHCAVYIGASKLEIWHDP